MTPSLEIEKSILSALELCSPKEKLFYSFFFNKEDMTLIELTDSIADQLCADAFYKSVSMSVALVDLQRSKPLRNIHYTNSLIELSAAYRIDKESEKKNVDQYVSCHSLRDEYLISIATDYPFKGSGSINSDVDKFIDAVLIRSDYASAPTYLVSALSNDLHIFDLIVLKKLLAHYYKIHPDAGKLKDFEDLKYVSCEIATVLDRLIILIAAGLLLWGGSYAVVWYFENKSLFEDLQKIVVVLLTVFAFILAFLGFNFPEKTTVIKKVRVWYLTYFYRMLGLDYKKVMALLSSR